MAHHVVQILPMQGRIGLILGRTCQPHTVDSGGVSIKSIARGSRDSTGPDLGLMVLAPPIANAIAAKRLFVNLDVAKERLAGLPLDPGNALWCVQGFLQERGIIRLDPLEEGLTQYFYNFTGPRGTRRCTRRPLARS
jgi:hypothetical protein